MARELYRTSFALALETSTAMTAAATNPWRKETRNSFFPQSDESN